jgi:cell division septal protein FtsQ
VLLDDDTAQLHLGEDRFVERLRSYLEVASALRERVPDIDYVDLRFEERVYVRPRGGGAAITAHPPSAAAKSF